LDCCDPLYPKRVRSESSQNFSLFFGTLQLTKVASLFISNYLCLWDVRQFTNSSLNSENFEFRSLFGLNVRWTHCFVRAANRRSPLPTDRRHESGQHRMVFRSK